MIDEVTIPEPVVADSELKSADGGVIWEQKGVTAPITWSSTAIRIVASKYFRGHLGKEGREDSVYDMVDRVVGQNARFALKDGILSDVEVEEYYQDLKKLTLNQYFSWNSPVWFNAGVEDKPQVSACFINGLEDDMGSIMDLAKTEVMLFKGGSGAGVNVSPLRADGEMLSGTGYASGPLSFMRGWDRFAGATKSGGGTRRAAKMTVMNVDHPDIEEFINCKQEAEKVAQALIAAGYDSGWSVRGGAYDLVDYQNANLSVRVFDEFMELVDSGDPEAEYSLTGRADPRVDREVSVQGLWSQICTAAHASGDPGLQFHDTTNRWHTSHSGGLIWASNPCSEFVYLADTSCNLASLNLMKFVSGHKRFNWRLFDKVVRIVLTSMEAWVGNASYPDPKIEENSHMFRPLGLGYANLGGLLMSWGIPYDSDEGRAWAAIITSRMQAVAWKTSVDLAERVGPAPAYEDNKPYVLRVLQQHWDAHNLLTHSLPEELKQVGVSTGYLWSKAHLGTTAHGIRNLQLSVLAPTGTIGFMMDVVTTGVEPVLSLTSYKSLASGGFLKLVNPLVADVLRLFDYTEDEVAAFEAALKEGSLLEAPFVPSKDPEYLKRVFSTAMGAIPMRPEGHVDMMAAVQPFLSGAISKTVNLPGSATVQDVSDIYIRAWKSGLKAVAVYRDGSKKSQPMTREKNETVVVDAGPITEARLREAIQAGEISPSLLESLVREGRNPGDRSVAIRWKLADTRQALTHRFDIGGHKGYITVGLYEDGQPGEIFITMSKSGSLLGGVMDAFATACSLALQYGTPLETLIRKFRFTRFEPSGFTCNSEIRSASSIIDYIFQWMDLEFVQKRKVVPVGESDISEEKPLMAEFGEGEDQPLVTLADTSPVVADGPLCGVCGSPTRPNGSCYVCPACGTTTGCS